MKLQFLDVIVLCTIGFYAVYLYFFDCRQLTDERRELIRLKSLRVSQKVLSVLLILLTLGHLFQIGLEARYVVAILVFATCISEIASKIYFERRY
jgi:hypothetical protein